MTTIFNELDREKTAKYTVKGCEKTIVVRGNGVFNLEISTQSKDDPHERKLVTMTVTQEQDICIHDWPCIACGMELIFKVDSTIDPNAHLFVQILYETCVPTPCCECD